MSENQILIKEKENPKKEKKASSKLTVTVSISGQPKNKNTSKSASIEFPKPLVKKIEGPFSKDDQPVEEMIAGSTYIFKATEFQESVLSPIKHIWWAEQLDDGEITDIECKKGENLYLDGDKVCFEYKAKKADKIRIYAYVANPDEKVSVEVAVVSFPFVIARSVRRAGECYGSDGEERTRDDIKSLDINYPQEDWKLRQNLEEGYDNLNSEEYKEEDKDDYIEYTMNFIKKLNKKTDDELFEEFRDLDIYAWGDLDSNFHNMIDFFKSNYSTSNKYKDIRLTNAIADHERTTNFIDGFINLLQNEINDNVNNISALKVQDTKTQFTSNEYNEEDGGDPRILGIVGLQNLRSLAYPDKLSGLGICVNGIQAYDISLLDFTCQNNKYEGLFKLEIFDHFGLDATDVLEDRFRKNENFVSWYMLQHLRRYRPFITYIPITYSFSGTLNSETPLKIKRNEEN